MNSKRKITKRISQRDIADVLCISESAYFKVEKRKTRLDIERLFIILIKLNISLKDFFKGINFKPLPQ